jgi:hypothetical protein
MLSTLSQALDSGEETLLLDLWAEALAERESLAEEASLLSDLSALRCELKRPLAELMLSNAFEGHRSLIRPVHRYAALEASEAVLASRSNSQLLALSRVGLEKLAAPRVETEFPQLPEDETEVAEEVLAQALAHFEQQADLWSELLLLLPNEEREALCDALSAAQGFLLDAGMYCASRSMWLDLGRQALGERLAAKLAGTDRTEADSLDSLDEGQRARLLALPPPPLETFLSTSMPSHAPPLPPAYSARMSAELLEVSF